MSSHWSIKAYQKSLGSQKHLPRGNLEAKTKSTVKYQSKDAMKAVIVICLLLVIAGSSNAQYVSTFGDEPMPEQPLNQRPRESAKNYKQRARLEKLLPRRLWKDQY
ncbi:uncharacterized protein LOC116619419 isoform X2 [Nematostella vectensis]|uniref:uncharacterized protein LOC116619419 isoform X2 n=1 Tax=Nematostella vectensis TaxID=45351 RepID=UPI0020779A66|nr:uncharacterized protein LOC116619419 isoform X2 [Nematostella vectensis]